MRKVKISQVIDLLAGAYGDRKWSRLLDPVGELVQTILSQNTSDTNSRRAYKSLIEAFKEWDAISHARNDEIAAAIRTGGLAEVKAKYIKTALTALEEEVADFDLSFLKNMGLTEARNWLIRLPGVGMKTASCVLLFSLGMPAFPVDTHVYRVAKRLGLIDSKMSVDSAHLEMEHLTQQEDVYRCHVLLIEHGRRTCKAQRPLCRVCALGQICPSYKLFIT
jgi:endonuclease III